MCRNVIQREKLLQNRLRIQTDKDQTLESDISCCKLYNKTDTFSPKRIIHPSKKLVLKSHQVSFN